MLAGRAGELERLLEAVDQRSTVVVTGAPGIGTTHLVREVVARRDALVGNALPALADRSHHPLAQALGRSLAGIESSEVAALVRTALTSEQVLVLEDLQWADDGTIEVLERIDGHLGVVVTVQSGTRNAARLLERLGSFAVEEVRLAPLDDAAIDELVAELRPDLLPGERRAVVRAACGVPLVATTLAASVDRVPGEVVPGALAIRALIARLPAAARTTLGVLAVAPAPVREEGLHLVDVLVEQGLVRRNEGRVDLVHSLYGDPQVLSLDGEQELAAWAHLATSTDVGGTLRAEALLHVGDAASALGTALLVADGPATRAEQGAALRVAALASTELRRRGEPAPDDRDHVELVVGAAAAANEMARHEVAAELIDGLGDLELLDADRRAAAVEAVRAAVGVGDRERATGLVARHRQLLEAATGPLRFWAETLSALVDSWVDGARVFSAASVEGAVDWLEVARAEARRDQDPAAEFEASRNLVMIRTAFGHHEPARELARECIDRADELGEVSWSAEFKTLDVFSRYYDGFDQEEAISWLSSMRTAPVRLETRAIATATLATLLADRGAVERSAEVLRSWTADDRLEGLPPLSQGSVAWGIAQRAWIIGDLDETIRIGRWVTERVPEGYPTLAGTQVVWRWAEFEAGVPLTAPSPRGGMLDCAELEAGAIDLLAAGEHDAAAERFLQAAESWRPILWRCNLRARWGAGHAHALARRHDMAVELLRAVDDELDASGCPALRPRLTASLRLAGVRPNDPGVQRGDTGLVSPRESEVLALVSEGCSSAEIARRLGISSGTVDSHIRSAVRKLGARGRVEAAAMVGLASV